MKPSGIKALDICHFRSVVCKHKRKSVSFFFFEDPAERGRERAKQLSTTLIVCSVSHIICTPDWVREVLVCGM